MPAFTTSTGRQIHPLPPHDRCLHLLGWHPNRWAARRSHQNGCSITSHPSQLGFETVSEFLSQEWLFRKKKQHQNSYNTKTFEENKLGSQSSSTTICQGLLSRECTVGVTIAPIASLVLSVKERNAVISATHLCTKPSIQQHSEPLGCSCPKDNFGGRAMIWKRRLRRKCFSYH